VERAVPGSIIGVFERVTLRRSAWDPHAELHAISGKCCADLAYNGASLPGHMARIRPSPEMPIIDVMMIRAWITSANPPSDANMRRPCRWR
jgi:hypothetical protein